MPSIIPDIQKRNTQLSKNTKKNSLGLWSMKFEFPWDFRKNN